MVVIIRQATNADAGSAVNTLRRSITELCTADHHGDQTQLASWLRNKTVETWKSWIATEGIVLLVADRHDAVVGVGMADLQGEILLNYVNPDARFTGVSKALLAALEGILRLHKVTHCRLESTLTARQFYIGCGYRAQADNTSVLCKAL